MKRRICIFATFVVLVFGLYFQTGGFAFVNFDDNHYFYDNRFVTTGLSFENIKWAFEIHGPSMWIPLTWLSHQGMVELFGVDPGMHHLANALLHALNAGLVFCLFFRLTRHEWASVLAAALFAVHPIHIESIAWVTERKDVLSLFFCLLALLSYLRYQRKPSLGGYAQVFALHALAVMAKPLAVTLPCVMLLLDFWSSAGRSDFRVGKRMLLEKLPLLGLSAFASWMTILCQKSIGAIGSLESYPIGARLENVVVSYATYLRRFFLPNDLSPFYPYESNYELTVFLTSLLVLIFLSVLGVALWRRYGRPAFLLGWLWYLGTLVPMIGIVQAGGQSMANRYTYLPFLGLYLVVASVLARLFRSSRVSNVIVGLVGVLGLAVLCFDSYSKIGYWKNTETLFTYVVEHSPSNYLARNNLGLALKERGDLAAAITQFELALESNPRYEEAINNLGIIEAEAGRFQQAASLLGHVLEIDPEHATASHNLAKVYHSLGQRDLALELFDVAIKANPVFAMAYYDKGYVLLELGRLEAAELAFRKAFEADPRLSDALVNLAFSLDSQGRFAEAEEVYRDAFERFPSESLIVQNLAGLLIRLNRSDEGDAVYEEGIRNNPANVDLVLKWADSLRARGQWEVARDQYLVALELDDRNVHTHNNLGVALGMLEEHEAALYHFVIASEIDPTHPDFQRNRDAAERLVETREE